MNTGVAVGITTAVVLVGVASFLVYKNKKQKEDDQAQKDLAAKAASDEATRLAAQQEAFAKTAGGVKQDFNIQELFQKNNIDRGTFVKKFGEASSADVKLPDVTKKGQVFEDSKAAPRISGIVNGLML